MPKYDSKTLPVYVMFGLSGASALIYQIIWARWLGQVFGNTTLSVSIVLGSFMTGLALGSWQAGRLLHRVKNPMRLYAAVELGIGIFALIFPFVTDGADLVVKALLTTESTREYAIVVKVCVCMLMLLVPTSLMGTTLPLLTEHFRADQGRSSQLRVGFLYAANTLGAAIGILGSGYLLIEVFGVRFTTEIAAATNFVVATIGLRLSRGYVRPDGTQVESPRVEGGARLMQTRLAIGIITATGAAALASEVLWTRTLETLIGNSTYAFSMVVILFLVGIASGSWVSAIAWRQVKNPLAWLVATVVAMGVLTCLSLEFIKYLTSSALGPAVTQDSLGNIFFQQAKIACLLFPLAFLSGACFPLVVRVLDDAAGGANGAIVARAYAWNTLGCIGGSLLAGFLIAPHFDFLAALYLVSALYFAIAIVAIGAVVAAPAAPAGVRRGLIVLGTLSLGVLGLAVTRAFSPSYFVARVKENFPNADVPFHASGLQGITTVLKSRVNPRLDMLLVNGMGMTVKVNDTKMMAHLPLLLHPNPENTLVICLGMGTTFRSAVSHEKRVTVVEIVNEVVDALPFYYPDADSFRSRNGSRIVVDDGRNFLKLTHERFDVITLDPPPPIDAAGVNSLYSKEFLELARSRLKEGGIMAHWMPLQGTGSGVDDEYTLESLLYTFASVFPYSYAHKAMNGIGIHILGSMTPINISAAQLQVRMANPSVAADLNEWTGPTVEWISSNWTSDVASMMKTKTIVSDDQPLLEFYLLRTLRAGGTKMRPSRFW